jgi:hypothetical protein
VQPGIYLISNKDCGMFLEVAQIDESGPRIAGLLLQLVPVAQKPAGSSREDMKRLGLDGRVKTAQNFPALSACQFTLNDTVCTIGSVIPYADSLGFSCLCVDLDSSSSQPIACDRASSPSVRIRPVPVR